MLWLNNNCHKKLALFQLEKLDLFEKDSQLRKCFCKIALWASLSDIFFIHALCVRCLAHCGWYQHWAGFLSYIRKPDE